jgi:hypothetical protein
VVVEMYMVPLVCLILVLALKVGEQQQLISSCVCAARCPHPSTHPLTTHTPHCFAGSQAASMPDAVGAAGGARKHCINCHHHLQ